MRWINEAIEDGVDPKKGDALLYLNSLDNVAFATNQGSFAAVHGVGSGPGWNVAITRPQ